MSPHNATSPYEGQLKNSVYRKDTNASPVILIHNLAKSLDSTALKSMLVFAKNLVNVDFIPHPSEETEYKTAIARFMTSAAAQEAKSMLDGKWNSSGDAHLIISYVPVSPGGTTNLRQSFGANSSDGLGAGRSTKYNGGSFSPFDQVSPTIPSSGFSSNEGLSRSDSYTSIFPSQSTSGSPLERQRVSGKSMISEDSADDETGKLISDPVAFAKNDLVHGGNPARRSTMPQLPLNRLTNLSISSPTGSNGANGLSSPRGVQSPSTYSNQGMSTPNNGFQNSYGNSYGRNMPAVNPADQHPPCNTLYVGNLPQDTAEDELKLLFSRQRGYKRLCFRVKQQGPMCFVEFEDVTFAIKALHELYGHMLSNSVKGGIRLSFSKNPLGVRATPQNAMASPMSPQGGMSGMGYGNMLPFSATNGPPPGLSMPLPYGMPPVQNGSYGGFTPLPGLSGNGQGPISPNVSNGLSARSPSALSPNTWGSMNGDYQYGRPLYG